MADQTSVVFQPGGKYAKWYAHSIGDISVSACGDAHYRHIHYAGREFARVVAEGICSNRGRLEKDILRNLNGNWSLVVQSGDVIYAAVDRTRSYPLLYAEVTGGLRLTDDFARICDEAVSWCAEAVEDLLWSGYPAHNLTLAEGVYQVPSGSYLRYEIATRKKTLSEYFSFLPTDENSDSDDKMSQKLVTLLDQAVRRAASTVQGRIILPLSGGMDSRVIAAVLKRNGFDNVICFSYGRKGNFESTASKTVADTLNYQWHFVEYSPATWSECMFCEQMKDYLAFACNGCSMPVYSNWYAVKALHDMGVLSEGDTFMPGHTGDFLTGGHIPSDLMTGQNATSEDVLSSIMNKHFSRWPGSPPDEVRSRLEADVFTGRSCKCMSSIEAAGLCEWWNHKERQAKMIINSCRIYEYFGYKWLTPFWDLELTDFYLTVPFRLRRNRKLFLKASVEYLFRGEISRLADIPLAGRKKMSPRQKSISRADIRAGLLRKATDEARRRLVRHLRLVHLNHALCLRDCYAGGQNNLRVPIRRMLRTQGLDEILNDPRCESVLDFVDRPVGQVNAFAILSLYVLAQFRHSEDNIR